MAIIKDRILSTSYGIALYLLLRNDYSWSLLSPRERQVIFEANNSHNVVRPDYANPENYNRGRSFDLDTDRTEEIRGQLIEDFLHRHQPNSIVELGPGSGYYTSQLVNYPSVEHYTAIDINHHFLDFLRPRLEKVAKSKNLKYRLITDDFMNCEEIRADAVILLSTVHHIPNRVELFEKLSEYLVPGGHLLAIDPSHYLPRMKILFRKFLKSNYLSPAYRDNRSNLSTHHFCTLGEYRKICRHVPHLAISDIRAFNQHGLNYRILNKLSRKLRLEKTQNGGRQLYHRLWSTELSIELERR